ncbi:type III ribulose-bisphosphate carboxylase [Patescibacteria group bacterium]|nr:type III ribulose-bisphosphate carboxylase [Patescibacteria group bacterium]
MHKFYRKFVHQRYQPKKNEIVAYFYLDTYIDFTDAAGGVAAESSIGTWTDLATLSKSTFSKLSAKAFDIDSKNHTFKVAYPLSLFEKGSIPQFLSGVAGNVFSMKIVKNLRLFDVDFSKEYVESFQGPRFGIRGVRRISGIYNRPILGSILKPKIGLSALQHATLSYQVFIGGIDLVKDDENLTDLSFSRFDQRVRLTLKMRDKAEKETGCKKICVFNVTAPPDEMLKRAQLVEHFGGRAVMIDLVSVGLDNVQMLRKKNLGLIIHGHRAGHSMFTKSHKHGMSMLVLAKLARLAGIDQLHTGTVVGKMEGDKSDVVEIDDFLRSKWFNIKPTFPIASGGLYPNLIPSLYKIFGKDVVMNFGGGVHGHPDGTYAGAVAVRQALDATLDGVTLKQYSKEHHELAVALKYWK